MLLTTTVPAGLTVMQALDRKADIETRYGGRYVEEIDGLEGDLGARRDWFWFVNGIEGDRSAADYRLRDGEVAWWDYRSWEGEMREPVVVGAFPEPFLHGFEGERRPVAVRYAPGLERGARAVGRLLGAESVKPLSATAPTDANVFLTVRGNVRFTATLRNASGEAGSPVQFVFAGDAQALARDPDRYRFRYEVRP